MSNYSGNISASAVQCQPNATAEVGEIEQCLKRLDDRIEVLHQKIGTTDGRFAGVLASEPPMAGASPSAPPMRSGLGMRLTSAVEQVERALDRLSSINERCQL